MYQPDLLETPEWAIQCFEGLTGLQVVVHDIAGELWPFLRPERLRHRAPCCAAVKATRDWACQNFEITRLRRDIHRHPEGRYHVCHAGIMEWVVPVFLQDRLAWMLFAGQAATDGNYEQLVRDIRRGGESDAALPRPGQPRPVRESEAQAILEALRQLRSRLLQWHAEAAGVLKAGDAAGTSHGRDLATRRQQIQHFLHHHHHTGAGQIKHLAHHLNLSESRTIHLVKELFGCSYLKLVSEVRLRMAASLLHQSALPVLEVALSSGFHDLSHFHRSFRRRFGSTPRQYRCASPA